MDNGIEKLVYSPVEIQTMLGLGKNQTYQLIRKQVFKSIQIGRRIIVPKWSFDEWLKSK